MARVKETAEAKRKQRLIYHRARMQAMRDLARRHPKEFRRMLEERLEALGYAPKWRRG